METSLNGAVAVGATALGATAVAFGVAGLLAFGPRHDVAPAAVEHTTGKPGCVMFCDEPAPAAPDSHGCTLFCSEPSLPPANQQGCQLFCELETSKGEYPR
ncbi:hypothetical protein B7C42_07707 [Nocardia cerradoensis]|uniref:Uncharacterized protein n=1 Tax=Nocardia cerradoensis TaxID=85688 RepID=A0A231GU89_9NOCA|nr:hypothetical protein B7C42_07707 [Nocardia cerradoensis]